MTSNVSLEILPQRVLQVIARMSQEMYLWRKWKWELRFQVKLQ